MGNGDDDTNVHVIFVNSLDIKTKKILPIYQQNVIKYEQIHTLLRFKSKMVTVWYFL